LKPYQKSDVEITDNFSLEGKFKLSIPDSKETGYFFLKKTENLIQMNIGKNYLLPEKKLLLDVRENLDINKLISKSDLEGLNSQTSTINVGDFLKLILGYEINISMYTGLKVFKDFNKDEALPSKVRLKTNEYELIILNKKIYE
tara:strand:- start:142 stop:573 length:432 start_codon:yes stop_codon:yes gene_type:complete